MSGSSMQEKYIKFGGIAFVLLLTIYIVFQFTVSVYNQYVASVHISNMEQFLITYNPNVCSNGESTKSCKDYEFNVYNIFSKYVISKKYASLKKRKDILTSMLMITHTNLDSVLNKILAGFPKDTFKEEVTLIN